MGFTGYYFYKLICRIQHSGFLEEDENKMFNYFNDSKHHSQNSSLNLSYRVSNASVNEVEKSLKDFQESVKNKSINMGLSDNEELDGLNPIPSINKIIEED